MIELKAVHKTYQMGEAQVRALDGVSLRIGQGEFVAVMGPSGSGKSTLMHVLGLLDRPDAGEYYLAGRPVAELDDAQLAALRNRTVGFVFQQFHLLPRMSALENAELPLIYSGRRDAREKAREKMAEVGLADRLLHRPNELSGGQQQRVAIARALVNDPLVILADEPTGNLDSASKEDILGLLKELNCKGKTLIVVTHESEVARHARRVITMRDGKIVSDSGAEAPSIGAVSGKGAGAGQKAAKAEFLDFCRQALFAMASHKVRSFLSILGILIGVASVIAMLALGQGAKASIEKQLSSLGSNLLVVRPGHATMHGVTLETGSVSRFTAKDAAVVTGLGDMVKRVSPVVSGRGQVVYGNKNWNTQIEGVGVDYAELRNSLPMAGRFFNDEEIKRREKVCLLGPTVARELFGENSPVGETVKINLVNFRVIGVLREKGSAGWRDQDDTIVMPVTTAMYRLLGKQYYDSLYVEVSEPGLLQEAQDEITAALARLHRIREVSDESLQIRNMADIRQTLETTTRTMTMLLGSIAAISLLVGGIGIMNIMLVSVTERTREIGLRKALGATNKDVLAQFLVEAVLLAFIGGLLGIGLGSGAAMAITAFAKWAVLITPASVILAAAFSLLVGVVFGIWPARKAAKLNPIEALRYE